MSSTSFKNTVLRHEIVPPFGGRSTFLTFPKTIFEISVNPGRNYFYYEVGLTFLKISAVKMSSDSDYNA